MLNTKKKINEDNKFGMFKGVFTPSILTILGVIMYLRFGWVVGEAGLLGSIAIVVLAHAVSFTTGFSICSIATNRTVKTGGDYYMISRSLGIPIGGALGIALFFALGFSTSLYVLGFAESFLDAFGIGITPFRLRLVGSIACIALTGITFFSTSLALKVQYGVLLAIALSLVSLFMGKSDSPPVEGIIPLWFTKDSQSFESVFAVFFPAVTGFTAGVAMSGDLKNPRRAIPLGTILAISVGFIMYLIIPIFLAFNVSSQVLSEESMVWNKVAKFPFLVILGVFAATLSSALGSILGAPRYLQALAFDRIVPRFMGKTYGEAQEPRVGTIITLIIALAGVLIGELNFIARIVTMFFLTSYGFLSLAAGIQAWSGVSSFRPDFKTPAAVSFIGAAICFGIMFKLDALAMAGSTLVMFGIFAAIKKREAASGRGDVWGGFWEAVVQKGVFKLNRRNLTSQSWRPNTLVLGGKPLERNHLLVLANSLFAQRGLTTWACVVQGDLRDKYQELEVQRKEIRRGVDDISRDILIRMVVSDKVYDGVRILAQGYGLPGMIPNTMFMGWARHSEEPEEFAKLVKDLLVLDFNLLMLSWNPKKGFGEMKTVDIWWGGMERNGPLMLLLAWMLKASEDWSRAVMRVNVIVANDKSEAKKARLEEILKNARVNATANMVLKEKNRSISEIIASTSEKVDLTIIGFTPPREDEGAEFVDRINKTISGLETTLMVRASTRFDGKEVLFDD